MSLNVLLYLVLPDCPPSLEGDSVVKFEISPAKKQYYIHGRLIERLSTSWLSELQPETSVSRRMKTIRLPTVNPETFNTFVQVLYTGRFITYDHMGQAFDWAKFDSLLDLYEFATTEDLELLLDSLSEITEVFVNEVVMTGNVQWMNRIYTMSEGRMSARELVMKIFSKVLTEAWIESHGHDLLEVSDLAVAIMAAWAGRLAGRYFTPESEQNENTRSEEGGSHR